MQLCLFADRAALQHLLDLVNAATRPIQFITEQLIGRTGRCTETAMNAGAQNRIRLPAFRCVLDEIGKIGLHG